jgi:hypothetical protein
MRIRRGHRDDGNEPPRGKEKKDFAIPSSRFLGVLGVLGGSFPAGFTGHLEANIVRRYAMSEAR